MRLPQLLFFLFTLCMFSSVAHRVQAAPEHESPAFQVDGKAYRLKELTGFSQAELRAQFDAEVKAMPDDALKNLLRSRGPAFRFNAAVPRPQLEKELWKFAIGNLLDSVATDLILASVTDRIVQQHGINLEEYFDLAALREGTQRQLAYLDFVYQHQHDAPSKADALHAEAVKRFRFKMAREYWDATGPEFRQRPAFFKWTVEAMRQAPANGDYQLKATLAHALLRQACEQGVYQQKAKEVFQFQNPSPQLLEIVGYRGSRKSLEAIVPQLMEQNGALKRSAASTLVRGLSDLAPGVKAQLTTSMGGDKPNLNIPTPGTVYEVAPNTFHIYGKLPQSESGAMAVSGTGMSLFYKVYAYELAVTPLLPSIQSWISEWKPDVALLAAIISSPGENRMPEVAFDPFVKKPYPDTIFADFERHRASLHELAASAVAVSLAPNREGAAELAKVVASKEQEAQTAPVKKAYSVIAARLSTTPK